MGGGGTQILIILRGGFPDFTNPPGMGSQILPTKIEKPTPVMISVWSF